MEKVIVDGTLLENNGGTVKESTLVKMSIEDERLKLLFICASRDIISKGRTYNDKLYEGDTVELFITLGTKGRYLELEVNPRGVQYAAIVENNGQNIVINYLECSPFYSVTDIIEGGWCSFWEIPLENLNKLGFDIENAYFNLYRQDYEGENLNLYALNPTMSETFHKTESFIKL